MEPSDGKTQVLMQVPLVPGVTPDVAGSLGSRYEILGALGEGGMGMVYRVRDRETAEILALKVLRPEIARDPAMIERFKNELRLARRITHKNVCRIHDFNRVDDLAYLTMEYVDGESLRDYLKRAGTLPPARVVDLARQIAAGLSEAHAQNVVHRDLKPENVMLARDGLVKVMDFGIARAVGGNNATTTQVLSGTPGYMAPEESQGKVADQRTDLYALGLILYECLTGRRAFAGATPVEVALKQLKERPVPPRKLLSSTPPQLEAVVLRCLEKEPARRFASAAELQRALAPADVAAPRPPRRVRKIVVLAAAVLLAIGLLHNRAQHAGPSAPPAAVPPTSTPTPALTSTIPQPQLQQAATPTEPADALPQGNATAQENVTAPPVTSPPEIRDGHRLFDWAERAAHRGNPEAQLVLARMYERGQGTARDVVAAYAWYRAAADAGNLRARRALERLTPTLSASEIAAAERRAHVLENSPAR
jgi:serine/threonine protein kinase